MTQSGPPPVRSFTALVPVRAAIPSDLAILLAPVAALEPSEPFAHAGRAEGVLLDDDGRVVAFIVHLAPKLDDRGGRTLVPVTDVTLTEGPVLRLVWTEEHLGAQPRLDPELRPQHAVDDDPAEESLGVPATSGVVPPGDGTSGAEVAKEGVEGSLLGATVGAIAGLALGGPIAAASMAVFFAVGGGVGGIISGAAHETKPRVTPLPFAPLPTDDHGPLGMSLLRLEERLRSEPDLEREGFVTTTKILPVNAAVEPSRQAAA
jgi:hypothetical protein